MLFPLLTLSAQWTVEREIFIPPEYYVGDETQLILVLKLDNSQEVVSPEELPVQDWLDIRSVGVEQDKDTVTVDIRFRSFYPGNRAFPELNLGGITLKGITLFTSSVSEQTGINSIRGLRDPFQLPGAVILLVILLLLLLLLPPALFFLIRFFLRRVKTLYKRFRRNAPFRRFSRLLVQLKMEEQQGDIQSFYTRLSGGIRTYLSDRTRMDYQSCTTREMERKVIPGISAREWQSILVILRKADLVKYAGEKSTPQEMEKNLELMDQFSKHWEEEEQVAYL